MQYTHFQFLSHELALHSIFVLACITKQVILELDGIFANSLNLFDRFSALVSVTSANRRIRHIHG